MDTVGVERGFAVTVAMAVATGSGVVAAAGIVVGCCVGCTERATVPIAESDTVVTEVTVGETVGIVVKGMVLFTVVPGC